MDGSRSDQLLLSPHRLLHDLPPGAVRWSGGFWGERFELCRKVVLPRMREALEHPDNAARLGNFRVAAGVGEGGHQGAFWSDGDCYKYLEALARAYGLTGDPETAAELDEWIELIALAQEPDGYLNTQIQLVPERGRWTNLHHHELYNLGHLMTAAVAHHRATGKSTLLDVARRAADYLDTVFSPRPPELAHFGFNPSNIMGLVDLFRETGEKRYLVLAGVFVDMRGSQPGGTDQNQDRRPLRDESEAVGHAVTASYLYAGAADVVAETGDETLKAALERLWANVTQRRMAVTGAIGAYHQGVSPRHDPVHEAFGREYELPSRTAYHETCANLGMAMWCRRMLALGGEAKYGDVMERVLYNSGLSGMDVDGTRFCYTNPLARHGDRLPLLSHDSVERWSIWRCYCCPPQVARTLAGVHEWAYGLSAGALWVHLYGSGRVEVDVPEAGGLVLRQETDYPWAGRVTLSIDQAPARRLALHLRIPDWAEGATLAVNGEQAATVPAGAYAECRRDWSAGDRVILNLPLRVRLVQAHPDVEETRNQVAVARGPVIYCLESVDLPADVPIWEVYLPRRAELTARHEPGLLGGVTVIEGEAVRQRSGEWRGRLYGDLLETPPETVPLRLVPYYAWLNRGPGEMRVWLPLDG